MTKVKTSELSGAALDWAVAFAEGLLDEAELETIPVAGHYWDDEGLQWPVEYSPSTDWAQGGPIIERETISMHHTDSAVNGEEWMACLSSGEGLQYGATPLIAAMRCYVASKLGDEVDVPEGLA